MCSPHKFFICPYSTIFLVSGMYYVIIPLLICKNSTNHSFTVWILWYDGTAECTIQMEYTIVLSMKTEKCDEYSCDSKSQIRKLGKQSSGTRKSPFLCLTIYIFLWGILVKSLLHLRCVATFTHILIEIMIQYAEKWM